jgi:hypothetical protein
MIIEILFPLMDPFFNTDLLTEKIESLAVHHTTQKEHNIQIFDFNQSCTKNPNYIKFVYFHEIYILDCNLQICNIYEIKFKSMKDSIYYEDANPQFLKRLKFHEVIQWETIDPQMLYEYSTTYCQSHTGKWQITPPRFILDLFKN